MTHFWCNHLLTTSNGLSNKYNPRPNACQGPSRVQLEVNIQASTRIPTAPRLLSPGGSLRGDSKGEYSEETPSYRCHPATGRPQTCSDVKSQHLDWPYHCLDSQTLTVQVPRRKCCKEITCGSQLQGLVSHYLCQIRLPQSLQSGLSAI
jgi:hypothetical protein